MMKLHRVKRFVNSNTSLCRVINVGPLHGPLEHMIYLNNQHMEQLVALSHFDIWLLLKWFMTVGPILISDMWMPFVKFFLVPHIGV